MSCSWYVVAVVAAYVMCVLQYLLQCVLHHILQQVAQYKVPESGDSKALGKSTPNYIVLVLLITLYADSKSLNVSQLTDQLGVIIHLVSQTS